MKPLKLELEKNHSSERIRIDWMKRNQPIFLIAIAVFTIILLMGLI